MISKLVKLLYKKYIYGILLEYVERTDNEYDDMALEFINDVIDVLLIKMDSNIEKLEIELKQ